MICLCTPWSQAKKTKTQNRYFLKKFSFFFYQALVALANNWSFVLYKEECEHKCDGNIFFLSWIKNFTLDCTSYYDKLFTYSDINFFFFKAATDTMYFIFSNNTQTIIAMGLGTCQGGEEITLQKIVSGCQQLKNNGSSDRRAQHSVAWETTRKSKSTKDNRKRCLQRHNVHFWTAASVFVQHVSELCWLN